ncbi:MAG: amino acid permease [Steroidobacteraceae bacterium]|nr:amino acid permease [Steroidobacteraceae bacterium]
MSFLLRRKPLDAPVPDRHHRLARTLGWPHLIALGVGAVVGTGIYTLIGVGAGLAGPAVILSFALAGLVCACAALAYAELASMMPLSGSAYTYAYSALGELIAWIVGWALILEYTVVVSAVAVGWSGYAAGFLQGLGIHVPQMIPLGTLGAMVVHVNPLAVLIIAVVAGLLILGTRESANINSALVLVKIAALAAFVLIALPHFDASHFRPFMPNGFVAHQAGGQTVGVMAAAAIIFFAFYGFDAVSTAAEEAKTPGRDLAIGIVGSMVICTLLYMVVAAAAIGGLPVVEFAASGEPLAHIVRTLGNATAATLIAGAAVVAMPTVLLAFLYGQSRIFFVMARDGLLPRGLGAVHPRLGTPARVTVFTAIICSALAGIFSLADIAALANAGTLAAFTAVGISLVVMRVRNPQHPRPFRAPMPWVISTVTVAGCVYLFLSLPERTKVLFFTWMVIGLPVYLLWGARRSLLARAE